VSVASVRRTQETRLFPKPWVFQRSEAGVAARSSLSKKLAYGDLFRQNAFPLRFQRGRGNAQGNLAAQGFRIHRTCQRGRPPAGSGQPVPRERGMPSPNRRFGEGTGNSEYSSEDCGPPNLPEEFFDSLKRALPPALKCCFSSHVGKALYRLGEALNGLIRVPVLDAVAHAVSDMPFQHHLPALVQG